MDPLQRESQARNQLQEDFKGALLSFVVPLYYPIVAAKESTERVIQGESTIMQEAPRILFGSVTALPSLASASFVAPLIPSYPISLAAAKFPRFTQTCYRIIDTLFWAPQRLLTLAPIGRMYHALNRVGIPLAVVSLALSLGSLAETIKDWQNNQATGKTVFYSLANNLCLTGGMLLFSGFALNPKLSPVRDGKPERTFLFVEPKTGTYTGSALDKILSLRDLMFRTAGPAISFYRDPRAFALAHQTHLDMDARMLWRAGIEQVVIKGAAHLQRASREGTMVLQHTHTQLPDFSTSDLAARLLNIDHGQFFKRDLELLPIIRVVKRSSLGRRAAVADRSFDENANIMYEMFTHPFQGRQGKAMTEYLPWTRTNAGKNSMVGKSGRLYKRDPQSGEVEAGITDNFGEDRGDRLWKPHWEPFARAIKYAKEHDQDFQVVPSVIRLKDFRGGAYRTVEIEYFEPVSVRPYVDQFYRQASHADDMETLTALAKQFRDDDVRWMKRVLLNDGYFTSYADEYYQFTRGKGGLLQAVGQGK